MGALFLLPKGKEMLRRAVVSLGPQGRASCPSLGSIVIQRISSAQPTLKVGLVVGAGVTWGIKRRGWFRTHCDFTAEKERVIREFQALHEEEDEPFINLRTVLQIVWQAIKDSPFLSLATILSGVLSALVPLLIPRSCRKFLDVAQDGEGGLYALVRPTAELLAVGIASAAASTLDYCLLTELVSRIHSKMSTHLFTSFLRQDMKFFDNVETAELMSRLDADVSNIVSTLKHTISSGLRNTITMVGGTVSLFVMAPKLAAIMVVALPTMVGIGSVYTKYLRKLSKKSREEHTKVVASAHESLSLIKTVRAFAQEEYESEKFEAALKRERAAASELGRGIGVLHGLSFLGVTGAMTLVLSYGGYLIVAGQMTAGLVSEFLFQSFHVQRSLMELAKLGGEYSRASSAMERVNELLHNRPTIPLSRGAVLDSHTLRGDISFHGVDFTYPSRPDRRVIKDVNLEIPAGKMYAIVGPSGSGKSTLLQLIERFYDVSYGTIRLDGHDIRHLDASWLRRQIGIVSQEPVLFDTTIMENLRYGAPHATEQEVIAACKQANCHEFITQFSKGYDTRVGERGAQLSGGQKQRIAIARALLLNPRILILDEATSSLDSESERLVQQALDRVMDGRTVLVVAHRLSTIRNADSIVVLRYGEIVEQGTHQELLEKNNVYAKHIATQLRTD